MPEPRFIISPDRRRLIEQALDVTIPVTPTFDERRRISDRYAAFLRTQEYVSRFPSGQQNEYTINIPGIQDFVRIPDLESRALRRQRWERFQRTNPVLPAPLQWIPPLINKLDDAQDLLFTGLALAIPIMRRLPKFFLGPFGVLLLINDLLNAGTCLLTVLLGQKRNKAEARKVIARQKPFRRYLKQRPVDFLRRFPWLSFLIQAPQALVTLTKEGGWLRGLVENLRGSEIPTPGGYGLNLGTLMALVTDTIWAPLRLAQGRRINIIGPPPDDIGAKATNYLAQPAVHRAQHQLFSLDDHLLLSAADNIAVQILSQRLAPATLDARVDQLPDDHLISRELWNPASIDVALEMGWNPLEDLTLPLPVPQPWPTYGQALPAISAQLESWWTAIATEIGPSDRAISMVQIEFDGGENFWWWIDPQEGPGQPQFDAAEQILLRSIEFGILPPGPLAAEDWVAVTERAAVISAAIGEDLPSPDTLRSAYQDVVRGFRSL